MEFISLVFRLGVVLAIFSFIWGILQFGLTVLRGGLPLPYPLRLALKLIQYFLIVDITILFCGMATDAVELDTILSGFILLMYFIGKTQNLQFRFMMVQVQQGRVRINERPNMGLELGVVILSLALFVFLAIMPNYAVNPASTWFYESIMDIESTPIFGFIFKIVGFFFTLSILFRMISSFTMILSGQAFRPQQDENKRDRNRRDDDTHFDDYEEV